MCLDLVVITHLHCLHFTKLHQTIFLYESTTAEKSADAKTAVGVGGCEGGIN